MKTRKHSKIITLLLALAMIMAMSISTFAASGDGTNLGKDVSINPDKSGTISNGGVREDGTDSGEKDSAGKYTHGTFTAVGGTITLDKEIIIFNTRASGTVVYLPNIKYEYTVTAADVADGKYITDEYGNKGVINDGVAAAINNSGTPFVQFSNGGVEGIDAGISGTGMTAVTTPYVTTTADGIAAEGHFNLSFDASKFSRPGVYRYKVTEAVADGFSKASAGIIDNGTYNADRYLDVYVQNGTSGLEIYGYVCFEDTKDTEFTANPGTAIAAKTNGFVSEVNDGDASKYLKGEEGVDIYETSNVKIQKVITGTMADMEHEFPFKAVVANETITKNPIVSYEVVASGLTESTGAPTDQTPLDLTATMTNGTGVIGAESAEAEPSGDIKLGLNDYLYVYGVPGKNVASTMNAMEKNDTAEVYTVSATYDGNDKAKDVKSGENTGKSVLMESSKTAEYNEAQTIDITKTEDVAVVTNKLNSISPTNVVMRFAPYLFILGGAMMLLVTSRRRRAEQE